MPLFPAVAHIAASSWMRTKICGTDLHSFLKIRLFLSRHISQHTSMNRELVPSLELDGAALDRLINQSFRLSDGSQDVGERHGVEAQVAADAQIVLAIGHSMNRCVEVSKLR